MAVLAQGLRVAGGLTVGRNMIAALARVAGHHEYLFVVPAGLGYESITEGFPNQRTISYVRRGGMAGRWLFDELTLPREIRAFRPHAILALQGRGLSRPPCVQACFPQMPYLFYPRRHWGRVLPGELLTLRWMRRDLKRQLRRTQLILCQTVVVERRIRQELGYTGEAYVCGGAVSTALAAEQPPQPCPPALRPLAGRRILLYLTKYYPHKNLEVLLELFERFDRPLEGVVVVTTIRPDEHPRARSFLRAVQRRGLDGHIRNLGTIPHEQVPAFYQHCHALLMPTLMETLGLPYLEAMRFGLPILTSDLDFAHEVCGEAALYFDPWNAQSICEAIVRFCADPALGRQLAVAGRVRLSAAFPTWDQIARETVGRLEALVHGSGTHASRPGNQAATA